MDTAPKLGATGREMLATSFMLAQLDNRANSRARRDLPRIIAVAYGGSSRERIPMAAGIRQLVSGEAGTCLCFQDPSDVGPFDWARDRHCP
jgi:hypothetical protein